MGVSKLLNDLTFKTKEKAPEIKFIFAVITFGAALYTTHKAAFKSREILEKRKENFKTIEDAKKLVKTGEISEEEYSSDDIKMDCRKANLEFVVDVVKNYAIPAGCTALSIWLFRGAMLDYKNLALGFGAAYNTLLMKHNHEMAFIKKELGDEKFNELEEGFKTQQIVAAQSTGLKDPKEKAKARIRNNPYSRYFDETHDAWTGIPDVDKTWLLGKQNELDAKLQRLGKLLLNEAYEYTGFEPTQAGQVMGWIRDNPDGTINHVDFGLFNISDQGSRWFVNGLEPIFLINFNVDPKPIVGRIGWEEV